VRKYIAEFIGTFALIFIGTGSIIVNDLYLGIIGHLGVSLSFGLVVMVMIYSIGDISGAHINPAVTIGFHFKKMISIKDSVFYIIFQLLGGFSASILLKQVFPTHQNLGYTTSTVDLIPMFIFEFIITFFLMFVIIHVATEAKEKGMMAGVAIGATVGLMALFAGPITGASMNPARSIAPALISGNIEGLWVYIVAPILGTCVAVYVSQSLEK
jgi:MIP family channel proteins